MTQSIKVELLMFKIKMVDGGVWSVTAYEWARERKGEKGKGKRI